MASGEVAAATDAEQAFYVENERDWQSILSGDGVRRLEALLPAYLQRQRWFGSKARNIVRARITDSVLFDEKRSALLWVSVDYVEGESDTWLMCLAMSFGEAAGRCANRLRIRFSPRLVPHADWYFA